MTASLSFFVSIGDVFLKVKGEKIWHFKTFFVFLHRFILLKQIKQLL